MALRTMLVDRFFVARLEGTASRADVDQIITNAASSARSLGRSIVYCGVNAPDFEPPSAELRSYIINRAYDLLEHASSLEIVIEGEGIKSSLLRTVIRGMVTLSRTRRPGPRRTHIHADVRAALERVRGELGLPIEEIERRLRDRGMISAAGR